MTGCLENKDGYDAMCVLMKELKKYPEIFVNQDDVNKVAFNNYQITMINSDYSINFKIDRLKLYNLLRNETDIFVTYEPENYPGVKINLPPFLSSLIRFCFESALTVQVIHINIIRYNFINFIYEY